MFDFFEPTKDNLIYAGKIVQKLEKYSRVLISKDNWSTAMLM